MSTCTGTPKPISDDTQLTDFVTSELKKGVAPTDITYEVCRHADVRWPEAEAFGCSIVQRQLKQRRKPRPVVGLAIFLGLLVVVIASAIFLVKAALDGATIAPLVFETTQPYSNSVIEDRNTSRWYRRRWVEAGQTIVINYEAAVNAGDLQINVMESWSSGPERGPYELSKTQQLINVQSGSNQIRIPVTDTGFYEVRVWMHGFIGRFNISWDVRQAN